METLPEEIINEIILLVPPIDRFRVSKVSQQFKKLTYQHRIHITNEKQYQKAILHGDILSILNCPTNYENFDLSFACYQGYTEIIQYILVHNKEYNDWDNALFGACERKSHPLDNQELSGETKSPLGRNKIIIELLLSKESITWQYGLCGACKGGNMSIVKYFINLYEWNNNMSSGLSGVHAPFRYADWSSACDSACVGGNIDIVKLMIEKGANKWSEYFLNACWSGNIDIVKLIIEKDTADELSENHWSRLGIADWNNGLYEACQEGHIHIVRFLIEKGANELDHSLGATCESGNMDIIQLLIDNGANNWHDGFSGACAGDNIEIVKLMFEKDKLNNPYLGIHDWNNGLEQACFTGNMEIVKFLLEKGPNRLNYAFNSACSAGHIDIVKLIIEKDKSDTTINYLSIDDYNAGLKTAYDEGHTDIVKLLTEIIKV